MQILKRALGLSAVWARTYPLLEGAVSSATTFHTLPSPLPVFSAFQLAGTFPRSSLLNLKARSLPSTDHAAALASATSTATVVRRIVHSSSEQRVRVRQPTSLASSLTSVFHCRSGSAGIRTMQVVPRPGALSNAMRPPSYSTPPFASPTPRPHPPA